jgi:hypothetical protein
MLKVEAFPPSTINPTARGNSFQRENSWNESFRRELSVDRPAINISSFPDFEKISKNPGDDPYQLRTPRLDLRRTRNFCS